MKTAKTVIASIGTLRIVEGGDESDYFYLLDSNDIVLGESPFFGELIALARDLQENYN